MKKKFINGLLLVALFVGFTGSMVSCKDYDDDKIGVVIGGLSNLETDLKAALEAQKKALQDQIDALQGELNTCKTTCAEFRALVENTYLTISSFNEFKDNLGNIYYTKQEVDDKLKNGYYTKEEIDAMFAALNFYTKSEIDEMMEDLRSKVTAEAIAKTIADLLAAENKTLTDALNNYFINDPVVVEYLKNGKGADIIKEHIAQALIEVNNSISEAKNIADQALKLAEDNKDEIDGLKGEIEGLKTLVGTLQDKIISLGNDLDKVRETANAAKAQAEANSLLIANLQSGYELLDGRVSSLENGLASMADEISAVKDEIAAMKEKALADSLAADALHREMLETISGLVSGMERNAETLGELKEDFENYKDEVSDALEALQDNIDTLTESINAQSAALKQLAGYVKNALAKFITGITINGTYCPAFGQFSLPVGIRSNVLVAYYGQLDDYGVQFPTARPAYYALPAANQWEMITDEDIEMIGALEQVEGYIEGGNGNKVIVAKDGNEGNAGTLYLTVNPTNRNFEGTQFEMINSRNESSYFKLSALAKSDGLLTWGYTRAGIDEQSENGFYEAKATIKADDINKSDRNFINYNFDDVKAAVKDILKYKKYGDGLSLTKMFNAVYNNISDLLEADAVKATWADDSLGVLSVISQYDIAAAAIKPLSFAFAKDVDPIDIPGLGTVEGFIDELIDNINFEFPTLDIARYTIVDIEEVDATSDGRVTFKITLDKDGQQEWITVQVRYSISGNFDNWKQELIDLVEKANDYIAELNDLSINGIKDKVKKALSDYIDEINNNYVRFLTLNKYLQPVLVVKANGYYARLSESHNYPARVDKANIVLIPTTYNAEILAPAYKKFLAVTNVSKDAVSAKGGDATCKNILDEANEQDSFKKVIEGGFTTIEFEAQAGYTYEILYSAVDYAGKVATKKFYVKVNE